MAVKPSFEELLVEVAAVHHSAVSATQALRNENSELRNQVVKLQDALRGELAKAYTPHSDNTAACSTCGHPPRVAPAFQAPAEALAELPPDTEGVDQWREEIVQPNACVALQLQVDPEVGQASGMGSPAEASSSDEPAASAEGPAPTHHRKRSLSLEGHGGAAFGVGGTASLEVPPSTSSPFDWKTTPRATSTFSFNRGGSTLSVYRAGSTLSARDNAWERSSVSSMPDECRQLLSQTENFPLWPTWSEARLSPSFLNYNSAMLSQNSLSSAMKKPISKIRGGDVLTERSVFQCLVLSPNSRRRTIWDFLSLICVAHDILTVPLIAFDSLEGPAVQLVSVLTTLFWTFDLPISFLSGYYHGGAIEMRPSATARYYIRRWFAVDMLVLITDWTLISLHSGLADVVGLARISKTLRLSRILRVFRLIRVMKVPELVEDIVGSFASESLITALGVTKSIFLIVILNHFIACGWYAISFLGEPVEWRWVTQLDTEGRDVYYRYATALHWSLTQFTPASMEVMPHNIYERVYSICVLISAMVTFSTFISNITTMMSTLRRIGTEKSKQRENLRKYVLENHLSIELGNKIAVFLRDQKGIGKKRVHESDIAVLSILPEALLLQMHFEVYCWRLVPHPFFFHYVSADESGLVEICHRALSEVSLRTSDELFPMGQVATKAYVLLSGTPELQWAKEATEVSEGQWISEVVLWVRWVHQGRLAAKTHCEFVAVQSDSFREVVLRRPHIIGACRDYAKKYRDKLLQLSQTQAVDVLSDFDLNQELAQTCFEKVCEAPSPVHGFASVWRTWSPRLYAWRPWQHHDPAADRRSSSI